MLKFRAAILLEHWHAIRRINISTCFRAVFDKTSHDTMPGNGLTMLQESLTVWGEACSALERMRSLRSVTIDITVLTDSKCKRHSTITADTLRNILRPLKDIAAVALRIEMNVEVPDAVGDELGPLDVVIEQRERPWNVVLFPRS
jgi:hypothetical protein